MMLNVQNKFDNFELECKLTTLIQRLMEPHINNFYKNQALLTELSQKYLFQVDQVSSFKEKFEPKYNELNQKVQILEEKLFQNFKICITQSQEKQQQIDQIKNQIQEFCILNTKAEKQYIESIRELQNVKTNNISFKSSIEQVVERMNEYNNSQLLDLKKSYIAIDQSQRKIINQISHQDNKLKVEQIKINEIKEELQKIQIQQKQDYIFDKLNQKNEIQEEEIKNIKIQLSQFNELQNKLSSIEIYLLYYQQFHVQRQINDSLFISLPVKFFYKYASFEKQKFDEFDKRILKIRSDFSIQELMNQQQEIVMNAQKRLQKVQETIKNIENNDQDSSVEDNKKNNNIEIQSEKPSKRKQSANLVYFEEQLRQLREQFEVLMDEKSNQINSLQQKIKQISDELYLSQIQFQASLEQNIQKQSQNQKQSITNLQQTLNELQNECQKSDYKLLKEELLLLRRFQQNMMKLTQNLLCLLKQDEYDKEGLQLLGGKDTQIDHALSIMNSQINSRNKKSSIMLNSDCISCSGSPIQLFQFFKVACLNYNPSDVEIEGNYVKRMDLIQQCLDLISTQEKKKKDLDPIKQRQNRQFNQRSKSIQASPRFFSTENKTKLSKLSQMKIFQ